MIVLRDTARIALLALGLGGVAAGAVFAYGWAPELRDWYGLTPEHPIDVPVLELWFDNLQAVASIFVAGALIGIWPRLRIITDAWVILVVAFNVLIVAVAFAAYGRPLLELTPVHYILELVALSGATAIYLDTRREWRDRVALVGGLVVAVLLLAGAVLESRV